MATRIRRPDGTQNLGVPFYSRVTPEAKAVLDAAAAVLDVPKWVILDAILRRTELDEHGRPVWWPDNTTNQQQELPLPQSA